VGVWKLVVLLFWDGLVGVPLPPKQQPFFKEIYTMSTASEFKATAMSVRAAGDKSSLTGKQHGGLYYPAHINKEGKQVTARWEGNVYINGFKRVDAVTGVKSDTKNQVIKLVAWNGRESKPGHGLADMCAKAITAGKEFSIMSLELRIYEGRHYVDNIAQVDHLGRQSMVKKQQFIIKSLPLWGEDSDKTIADEIQAYQTSGQATFAARPQFWSVSNHPDNLLWKAIIAQRSDMQYIPGAAEYGHARVVLPEGAQVTNAAGNNGITPEILAAMQLLMAAQMKTTPVAPPAPVAPPPPAGIDPMVLAQMMANPQMLALLQGVGAQSAVPQTPAATTVPPVTGAAAGALSGNMPI
jgi:hypothetical protein